MRAASVAGFWNVVPDAATTIRRKLGHMGYQPGCQLSFVTSALLFLIILVTNTSRMLAYLMTPSNPTCKDLLANYEASNSGKDKI